MRPPRVVLGKPGLDGHDRGIKVVAMALRDAGAEVVYLGLRRTPEEILQAAADEDADVIGVSFLSGAHLRLGEELLTRRVARGLQAIPVVVGGTIPPADAATLRSLGAAAVFPVGTDLADVVSGVVSLARRRDRARERSSGI